MVNVINPSSNQTSETILPQTEVLDEPDTLDADNVPTLPNEDDSSDSSDVEILDGGSDVDIREETDLEKFSRMLHEAQKKASAKEKVKGNKQKMFSGHSRTTRYRQKRFRDNLATQGYLPVYEFMKQMAQKKEEKLTASQELSFEESEEGSGSDNDSATVSRFWTNEPSISEGTDVGELAPAASEERPQDTQGPSASKVQVAQGLREEEEEGSRSDEDGGIAHENVKDVAQKNGTHLGHTFWVFLMPCFDRICRIVLQRECTHEGHTI